MTRRTRIALLTALIGTLTVGTAGIASAHNVNVAPAGTCQFMGGPGNPAHAGHANGHTVALAAERSDAISIGSC